MLILAARHARACLVVGLLAGLLLPGLAAWLRPYLPQMVAALLFLTALRIGPREAVHSLHALGRTALAVLVLQLALPLALVALLVLAGLSLGPLAAAMVLVLSAPSISGAPNFTLMTGHDPAPALRLLVLGTALVPLTALPVFWALPVLGDPAAVLGAAGRLMAVIFGATGLAFALRLVLAPRLRPQVVTALDGATAIALAVVVVALMSALAPALARDPLAVLGWLAAAFAVNFGFQLAAFALIRQRSADAVALSIIAGNRNIALFLVALPQATTDPLLIFIGCYQIPMYLTPVLLGRFYGAAPA
ncbi:MAG: hypothetical protein KDK02_04025 [Rhodobacteraceae bacterium]|nr:hypothetical protein [Paracoccaceae bacterium]